MFSNVAPNGRTQWQTEVWPLRLAGAARMMQDPHILQYSTGSAALVMDTILLKCEGPSSQAVDFFGACFGKDIFCETSNCWALGFGLTESFFQL
jgi:hypothetical protein